MTKEALYSAVGVVLVVVAILNLFQTPYGTNSTPIVEFTFVVNLVVGLVMVVWNIVQEK